MTTDQIINQLTINALEIIGKSRNEIERTCWVVVHEYCNGAKPSEYDIREIDESLYLKVLERVKGQL
ncbi:hypothetical protein [Prochlorococcus marinus]|uniref:hypothetical protein n=1 Tax=Prochlorococcus marinus TaxID=1219 RepID=UPI000067247D|nr:hypothetical protein [Prochlorococcus marinus]